NNKTILVAAMFFCWTCTGAGQSAKLPPQQAKTGLAGGPGLPPQQAKTGLAGGPGLVLEPCQLPGVEGEARCGSYEVFENRAATSGRVIKLKIVILKALSKTPAPDPIFWLHGGPGAAATGAVGLGQGGILARSRQERDLVFVDQRGTGGFDTPPFYLGDKPGEAPEFFFGVFPPHKGGGGRRKL